MTRALPCTKANIKCRIEAARAAGLFVTGILPDGTVLTAESPPELITIRPFEGQDNAESSKWGDVQA
jgi:hypothetical protein